MTENPSPTRRTLAGQLRLERALDPGAAARTAPNPQHAGASRRRFSRGTLRQYHHFGVRGPPSTKFDRAGPSARDQRPRDAGSLIRDAGRDEGFDDRRRNEVLGDVSCRGDRRANFPAALTTEILRLMIPSRQRLAPSNTPEPEFPVVATSAIAVSNRPRRSAGIAWRGRTLERAVPSGMATTTASPG